MRWRTGTFGDDGLRILLISRDPEAALQVRRLLEGPADSGSLRLEQVPALVPGIKSMESNDYDFVLVDIPLEGHSDLDLLLEMRRSCNVVPVVLLNDELGSSAMKRGQSGELSGGPAENEWRSFRSLRCGLCVRRQNAQCQAAEDTLRKLSRAVEQSADLVIITALDGTIEYVNPAFEVLTGYTMQEAIGRKPNLLKSGVHNPGFYKELWADILAGRVFRGVLVNKKKNGELYYAEKTITPVRDAAGKITHFISNDRDISERKRLEAQLLQATKMDAIGQLAGGVAHDFNNLLMVISSYAELAIDSVTPGHALRHNLDEILAASRRAADLTRQLLAFSRKQIQSLQVLDLNTVVQDLGRMLPRLIGEDIQLTLICGKELGKIKADPVQMEQIIMNLAANARDAMPHGGKLSIETSNIQLEEEYIHRRPMVPPGEYVLLTVTDSGQGIPAEHLPHIFEPFFTTKDKGKGTGLGLATVYGIVKQSGGFVWVYSEAGLGTTFRIYLPEVEGQPKKTTPAGPGMKETARGSETLLLVEDEEAVRRAACEFLTMCGYHVLEARDGLDALQLANAYKPAIHLLVTDVVMPRISGSQVAQQLAGSRPEMRVLYVSGYASPTLLRHGVHAGETMFLQKPFTLKMLAWKVRQALSAPRETTAVAAPPVE
jgi:two-component system cell cycle sensor histidine kinase/response regulator CckA